MEARISYLHASKFGRLLLRLPNIELHPSRVGRHAGNISIDFYFRK